MGVCYYYHYYSRASKRVSGGRLSLLLLLLFRAYKRVSGGRLSLLLLLFQGVQEGFWWAFVSMTTVGYGDKCPKFIASRIFSIIWILIGITIIGIFTATLTNAIMGALNPADPDMHGKNVGEWGVEDF